MGSSPSDIVSFHPLFYTVQPNFYQTLSDMVAKLRALDVHEDKMIREGKHFVDKKEFLIGEDWITADKLSMMLVEKLNDFHRAQFVKTIERLTNHNYGYLEKDYINGFSRFVASQSEALEAPDLMYKSEGRPFMTSDGRRKSCWSKATVVGNGVGKYVINGVDFRDMFPRQQDRKQASSGIEKYQTESTNELQNSTEVRQIENDGSVVESTPENSPTETITVERIETVQEPDDITMDNIQYIG
ncbi:small ribosomal subunit protein uS9m-like [Artemia franciscana]|uniref:Uncharacterized protein n=1 Tax=Artemia franciscana TaxID=6661 RepID=A0AA88IJX9_ARTSF|nr:hypothetical protein QYM36_002671 [Artemia franciscana]